MFDSRQYRKAQKRYDSSSHFYHNANDYAKDDREARQIRKQAKRWRSKARRRIDKMISKRFEI